MASQLHDDQKFANDSSIAEITTADDDDDDDDDNANRNSAAGIISSRKPSLLSLPTEILVQVLKHVPARDVALSVSKASPDLAFVILGLQIPYETLTFPDLSDLSVVNVAKIRSIVSPHRLRELRVRVRIGGGETIVCEVLLAAFRCAALRRLSVRVVGSDGEGFSTWFILHDDETRGIGDAIEDILRLNTLEELVVEGVPRFEALATHAIPSSSSSADHDEGRDNESLVCSGLTSLYCNAGGYVSFLLRRTAAKFFHTFPNLTTLVISPPPFFPTTWARLTSEAEKGFQNLHKFSFIVPKNWRAISSHPDFLPLRNLRSVTITCWTRMKGEDLIQFLPTVVKSDLRELELDGHMGFDDDVLSLVSTLYPNLEYLKVLNCFSISDTALLAFVAKCRRLRALCFTNPPDFVRRVHMGADMPVLRLSSASSSAEFFDQLRAIASSSSGNNNSTTTTTTTTRSRELEFLRLHGVDIPRDFNSRQEFWQGKMDGFAKAREPSMSRVDLHQQQQSS